MPEQDKTITARRTACAGRRAYPYRGSPFEPALVFVAAMAIPLYLALRGGGWDVVERQQATLALWWLAALGILFGVLPRARPARGAFLVLAGFGALGAWTVAALFWTESAERTFIEAIRTMDYAGLVALTFFGVHRHTWRAGAAGLLAGAGAICLFAVATRVAPDLMPTDTVALQFGGERLSYPLDYWNATAYWGAAVLAACVAWSVHSSALGERALVMAVAPIAGTAVFLSYSRGGAVVGLAALVAVVIASQERKVALVHAGLALALTAALAGVISTQPEIADGAGDEGGGLVAVALLTASVLAGLIGRRTGQPRRHRKRLSRPPHRRAPETAAKAAKEDTEPIRARALVISGSVIAVVIAGTLLVSALDSRLSRTPYDPGTGEAASRFLNVSDGRGELYTSALDSFYAEPVLGTGPGTFGLWHDRTRPAADRVQDAHSLYLEALAEIGAPGFLLVLAAMAGIAALAGGAARRLTEDESYGPGLAMCAMFGVIAVGSAIDWLWEVPAVTVLGLAAGAFVCGSRARPLRRHRLAFARVAAVAALIGVGALHVPPIVASERRDAALFQFTIGNEREALELADEAVDAQPWAATARITRALIRVKIGELDAAADDVAQAVRLEPTNRRHLELQLRVALLRDDLGAAAQASEALRELMPGGATAP